MNMMMTGITTIDGLDLIRKSSRSYNSFPYMDNYLYTALFEMRDRTHISIAGNKPDVSLVEFDRNKLKDFVKKLKEEVLCEYSAKDS